MHHTVPLSYQSWTQVYFLLSLCPHFLENNEVEKISSNDEVCLHFLKYNYGDLPCY